MKLNELKCTLSMSSKSDTLPKVHLQFQNGIIRIFVCFTRIIAFIGLLTPINRYCFLKSIDIQRMNQKIINFNQTPVNVNKLSW